MKLSKITYLYLYIPDLTLGALGVMYEIPKSGPITISTGIDQPDWKKLNNSLIIIILYTNFITNFF